MADGIYCEQHGENCYRLSNTESRVSSLEETTKQINESLQDNRLQIVYVKADVKQLMVSMEEMKDSFKELITSVKTLSDQPAKRWETLIGSGISAGVGAVLAIVLSNIKG